MGTPVEKFIREAHSTYNVKYALTNERLRKIRYQLKMADIKDMVEEKDTSLALDIVLADYGKSGSNLRTASASPKLGAIPNLKSAGMCPRCSASMQFVRLATAREAKYCQSCHVCI